MAADEGSATQCGRAAGSTLNRHRAMVVSSISENSPVNVLFMALLLAIPSTTKASVLTSRPVGAGPPEDWCSPELARPGLAYRRSVVLAGAWVTGLPWSGERSQRAAIRSAS